MKMARMVRQGLRNTFFGAACLCAGSGMAADPASNSHVFGYQDTKTGAFHPLAAVVPEAVAPITGTVEVTFNVKLVSTFAKGTVLDCTLTVGASSVNETSAASSYYDESATASVTISGTTATCKTVIPYSWLVTPASSTVIDSFSGNYSIVAVNPSATSAAILGATSRSSSSSVFSTTKIPASGTISSYTVNVTL